MMLPFADGNLIGVDIGSTSIKIAHFKGGKGSYTLKAAAYSKLPAGPDAAAGKLPPGFISELIASNGIKGGKVCALASVRSLAFSHLNVPVMPENEMKEAVRWEVRKETGLPPSDLVSDFTYTGAQKTGENTVPVIAFSAKRSEVDGLMAIFKDSGLEVRVIDTAHTALLAAFDLNNVWEDGVNYSMVDIGAVKATLVIMKNRRLMFAREISFGGMELTSALAEGLGKEESVAEEYKITHGLKPPEGEGAEARRILTTHLTGLCRELHRSFDYYQAQFREGAVSRLFLCGGTARIKGIDGFVTETLGIESFVDDPFRKVGIPGGFDRERLKLIAPCMSIAVGLATRT